jgi:hypothetical protein
MKKIFLFITFCLLFFNSFAQLGEEKKSFTKKIQQRFKNSPRILTFGWSFIDDNGNAYSEIFSPKSYNSNLLPLTFKYDRYYYRGWSVTNTYTFVYLKQNTIVNNNPIIYPSLFFSGDIMIRYNFNRLYNFNREIFKLKKNIFDIYFITGFGYVNRDLFRYNQSISYNFGGGVYARFNKHIGINIEGLGKLGLKSPLILTNSNFIHLNAGVSYFIGEPKTSSIRTLQ